MANQAQKNAVRRLHELSDGSEITATYGEGGYPIAHTDPYELSAVINAGGVLSVPAPAPSVGSIVLSGLTAPSVGAPSATETYSAVVTIADAVGGEDVTSTYTITNVGGGNTGTGYGIASSTGIIDYTAVTSMTIGDTFDVVATANFDGSSTDTITVTVVA